MLPFGTRHGYGKANPYVDFKDTFEKRINDAGVSWILDNTIPGLLAPTDLGSTRGIQSTRRDTLLNRPTVLRSDRRQRWRSSPTGSLVGTRTTGRTVRLENFRQRICDNYRPHRAIRGLHRWRCKGQLSHFFRLCSFPLARLLITKNCCYR
jgi:hypothetical protein